MKIRVLILLAVTTAACKADGDSAPGVLDSPECQAERAQHTDSVQWKRAPVLERELSTALELDREELCSELGRTPCFDLHRIALGDNEPLTNTIYTALSRASALTPLVTERVVLASCARRVELDVQGPAVVFTALELDANEVDPQSSTTAEQVRALYRRLLSRDATTTEIEHVAQLARGRDPASFAKLACFAIATTTESLFF